MTNPPDIYGPIIKRSVTVAGFRTAISAEECFWIEIKRIAAERRLTIGNILAEAAAASPSSNLSSALRQFVLFELRARAFPETADRRQSAMANPAHVQHLE